MVGRYTPQVLGSTPANNIWENAPGVHAAQHCTENLQFYFEGMLRQGVQYALQC